MFFIVLQGITLFQAVAASMADTSPQRTSPLNPKKHQHINHEWFYAANSNKYYQYLINHQWFCAAKSNTTDQEQAYIKKIAPAKLYKVRNTIQYVQHICSKS